MHRRCLPNVVPFLSGVVCLVGLLVLGGCSSDSPEATEDASPSFTPTTTPASPPDGLDLPNGRLLFEDIVTGGQPTEAQLRAAHEQGFQTVVNLRPEGEFDDFDEQALVEELGMTYISIPISGANDVTRETATALDRVLADTTNRPLLMHCSSGNRVGSLFAARAYFLHDTEPERALEIGTHAGLTALESPLRDRWNEGE